VANKGIVAKPTNSVVMMILNLRLMKTRKIKSRIKNRKKIILMERKNLLPKYLKNSY